MKIAALVSDAFGGRGGIAQHNRFLLEALCASPCVEQVVALPRVITPPVGVLPDRLIYFADGAAGNLEYVTSLARLLRSSSRFDVVVCGHLNLLPAATLLAWKHGSHLIQIVHGIEAWKDPGWLRRRLARRIDALVSVSELTMNRTLAWARCEETRTAVIPNCVDLSCYAAGPKRADLVAKYGIHGKKVILTVGRLCASEAYKGHDRIIDALPRVAKEVSNVVYLIAGEGDDKPRLEAQARALGVSERVVFAGYIDESEKADYYRLGDVFAMPSRGEGFGMVFLEAWACGLPIIASAVDGSREVARAAMGDAVDPDDDSALTSSLINALINGPRQPPGELTGFDVPAFRMRWNALLAELTPAQPRQPSSGSQTRRS